MKTKKRFIERLLILFLAIIISVSLSKVIVTEIIFNNITKEDVIMENYETRKEKYELLKNVAKESIQVGKGIDTKKIPDDKIQYRIENKDGKVIFNYYIKDSTTSAPDSSAKIILSKEYNILEEKYSIEMYSLDECTKILNSLHVIFFYVFSIGFTAIMYIILMTLNQIKKIKY